MRMSQKEGKSPTKSRCDAEFCRSTSASSEGHALFWEVEDANPSWLRSLPNHEVYEAMKNRLEHAGNHFKGRFRHWDVNNEMMHGSFLKIALGKYLEVDV